MVSGEGRTLLQVLGIAQNEGGQLATSHTPAKITWQNDKGQLVQGFSDDLAWPEYPGDGPMSADRSDIRSFKQ